MFQVEKRQQRSDIGNYKELEDLVDASQLIRDTGLNIDNDTIALFLGDVDVVEVESVKEAVQVQSMKEVVQVKSVKEKQKICWMCGNSFSTTRLLLQHAEKLQYLICVTITTVKFLWKVVVNMVS